MQFVWLILKTLILTILTQIGGLTYLISYSITRHKKLKKSKFRWLIFPLLYLCATFLIVPVVAPTFGRRALPVFENNGLKPHTFICVLFNRNYITNAFYKDITQTTAQFYKRTGHQIHYLDANFPFINGFPLLPHLSHNDGKKLDLAFIYNKNKQQMKSPTLLGYGYCEAPTTNEWNQPEICRQKGFNQYNLAFDLLGRNSTPDQTIDKKLNQQFIHSICKTKGIRKIFIEPHLKKRWNLSSNKIRFHGCHAARHDDHMHLEYN